MGGSIVVLGLLYPADGGFMVVLGGRYDFAGGVMVVLMYLGPLLGLGGFIVVLNPECLGLVLVTRELTTPAEPPGLTLRGGGRKV